MKSIVDGSLHDISSGDGSEELYDMDADPAETVDLAELDPEHPEIARLRRMMAEIRAMSAGRAAAKGLRS